MNYLVIVRHGLTEWTGRFTGWTDIDLAPSGVEMTKKYAVRIKEKGIVFDLAYASCADFIKTGSMCLSERLAMYNLLIEIEKCEINN